MASGADLRLLRLSSKYELVAFPALSASQQQDLTDLRKDPQFYGILQARVETGLPLKSVCVHTAALLQSLEAGTFDPASQLDEETRHLLGRLWADGVLEIGGVVSPGAGPLSDERGRIPCFDGNDASHQAIRYGWSLDEPEVSRLSAKLYFYGRIPISRRLLQNALEHSNRLLSLFRATSGVDLEGRLEGRWKRNLRAEEKGGWLAWDRKGGPSIPKRKTAPGTFKLYINPSITHFTRALSAFLSLEEELLRVRSFKIASDVTMLTRPDKFVLYFETLEDLLVSAARLAPAFPGIQHHALPFSSPCGDYGPIFTMGFDLVPAQDRILWLEKESSRITITNRVAASLRYAASRQGDFDAAWAFLMTRLRETGVDTHHWRIADAFAR